MKRGLFLLLLVLLSCIPITFAHEDGEQSELEYDLQTARERVQNQRSMSNDPSLLFPWTYAKDGNWFMALFMTVAWFVILRAFYVLVMLVVVRHVEGKK